MSRPNICLNMIVKNEAHVIERCLASLVPHIDSFLIVDTGSTDATVDVINGFMDRHKKPGEVVRRPWVDFAHNRTEAFKLAQSRADYSLFIDADETFETEPGFTLPPLHLDAYEVPIRFNESNMTFYRLQLVSNALPFRYVGVLHEVITCGQAFRRGRLTGATIRSHADSARNSGDLREKYARDAQVLEEALRHEPNNTRYTFYLAQSYKDAGKLEEAIKTYSKRARMSGFEEEGWYSELMCGRLLARLQKTDEARIAYLNAYERRPTRAEPLCDLARLHRLAKGYHQAYLFATQAAKMKLPNDVLFVENDVYGWRSMDELSISAFYVGQYEQSKRLCETLLARADLPAKHRGRVQKNLDFAKSKLAG